MMRQNVVASALVAIVVLLAVILVGQMVFVWSDEGRTDRTQWEMP